MDKKKIIGIVPNGLIFMVVATVLAYAGCRLQLRDKIFMGTAWTGAATYEYNPVMYILGAAFYWGLLLLLYFTAFAKGIKRISELTTLWRIAAYALSLLQAWIMYELLYNITYRSGDYLPVKNSLRLKFTVYGWPIMTAAFISVIFVCCIAKHRKDGKEQKSD